MALTTCKRSRLAAFGLDIDSRVGEFWRVFGEELDDAEATESCFNIARALKMEFGCITIGCMLGMSYHSMHRLLSTSGWNCRATWLPSIEKLLEHEFARLIPSSGFVPDSYTSEYDNEPSNNGSSGGSLLPLAPQRVNAQKTERFPAKHRLGDRLQRENKLHLLRLPFETYVDNIDFECDNPRTDKLTSNDTRAIASEGFKYLACKHDYVCGDKIVFKELGRQTQDEFPYPYKNKKWWKIYKNRAKNGRSTKGQTVCLSLSLSISLLWAHALPVQTGKASGPLSLRANIGSSRIPLFTSSNTSLSPLCSL